MYERVLTYFLIFTFLLGLKEVKSQEISSIDSTLYLQEVLVKANVDKVKLLWNLLRQHDRNMEKLDTTLYYSLNFGAETVSGNIKEQFKGVVSYELKKGKVKCFIHEGEYVEEIHVKDYYRMGSVDFSKITDLFLTPRYRKFKKNTITYNPSDTFFYLSNKQGYLKESFFFDEKSLKKVVINDTKQRQLLGFKLLSVYRQIEYNKAFAFEYLSSNIEYTFKEEKYYYTLELKGIKEPSTYHQKIKIDSETPESLYQKLKKQTTVYEK